MPLLLVLLCWGPEGFSETLRRNWYFEQLAQSPEPSANGKRRHQLSFHTVSYPDAFSVKIAATVDLSLFEIVTSVSQRLFLSTTTAGASLREGLASEHRNLGVEIARFRSNPRGAYGRLAIGALPFLPNAPTYWKFSLSTGRLATAEIPWELRLGGTLFLSNNKTNDFSIVTGSVARHFDLGGKRELRVGGFATWGQAIKTTVQGESTLLSLGPSLAFDSSGGLLSFSVPVRVWLDINPNGGFLSDFSTPAFSFGWQIFL